ncbi:VOC family protein [Actinomadura sp. LOL_016]|uniref:VOC family protein n=1 Tax=unclassified Actinomadura TaxID=2626254 RepID=UPI003A80C190
MSESGRGPLRHADLFHTGIVVDDLSSAAEELGGLLDTTWRTGGAEVRLTTGDGVRTVRTAYALSHEGGHRIELCQSIEGTLWTASAPGHAHHLGYWVEDVAASSAELERLGSPRIASISIADGAPPLCAYHRTKSGLYVEIVGLGFQTLLLPTR